MIYQAKAKRFEIYLNPVHKTMAQVKAETGCDIIFNGTWINNTSLAYVGNFKAAGKALSKEYNSCIGYAWNSGALPVMRWSDLTDCDNFICATPLIMDGKKITPLNYPKSEVGGKRGRTAMGQKADGTWAFLCIKENDPGELTPEEAQDAMFSLGCVSAMLYDGGGSSEMTTPDWTIATTRLIYNFVCVWLDGGGNSGDDTTVTTPAKTYLHGIDISENQGLVDWGKAENEIDFAMIRVVTTDNKGLRLDKQAIRNMTECNRIGIPCGVYAFSYADNEAEAVAEANLLLNTIKPFKIEYPVCFDFEYTGANNIKAKGVTPTKALCSAICHAFCKVMEAAGYYTTVYTNDNFISQYYDSTIAAKYDLWVPTYPLTVPTTFDKPPRTCGMWQYSDKGSVSGITGNVDLNVSYRDYPTLIKNAGLNNLTAPAPTEAELAAAWVKEQGISDGERPTATATRQELWTMLYRALNK